MKRLVEGGCVFKHTIHISHVGHVPIIEGLVERGCALKHPSHIRHIGHVPIIERLVEFDCVLLLPKTRLDRKIILNLEKRLPKNQMP